MSRAARTVLAFGIYVMITGAATALTPDVMLRLLRLAPAQDVWVRVLGAQIAVVGFYYCASALGEARPFFRATLYGRTGMALFLTALVALGALGRGVLPLVVVEIIGAVATGIAMSADARAVAQTAVQPVA